MSQQYINLCKRIIREGHWIDNKRTGKKCLTTINADFEYDCRHGEIHLLTTKQAYWRKAVAEMLGYIKGCNSAKQFRELGTDTWDANVTAEIWQKNPYCQGKDDMGRVYGVQGRDWQNIEEYDKDKDGNRQFFEADSIDQLRKVYENLKRGIDDRGEIITYWNVADLNKGCLRPCMYSHTFSLLAGTLYLTSYQRSDDVPLGHGFNQIQVSWFLAVMARITGHKPGIAYHKIVNAHIYSDQLSDLEQQLDREPYSLPYLVISDNIQTLEDLENSTLDDYSITNYKHHEAIKFKFSV